MELSDRELFEAALMAPSMADCVCEPEMEIVQNPDYAGVKHMLVRHDDGCPLAGPMDAYTKSVVEAGGGGSGLNRAQRRAKVFRQGRSMN